MEFIKDELQIKKLVNAFCNSTEHTLDEIAHNYNMENGNFRPGGSWDIRFGRIEDSVEGDNDIIILNRERGIWKYKALLLKSKGILLVFTKEKNLEKVIKEKSNTEKIHYFHALVSLNDKKIAVNIQLDLFTIYDDAFEKRREKEVQKILQEYYSYVNEVYFVVGTENGKKIDEVKVQSYNNQFEFIDEIDLKKYISKGEYGDILPSMGSLEDSEVRKPLVGIKPGLKKRNEKKIPDHKQEEKKEQQKS